MTLRHILLTLLLLPALFIYTTAAWSAELADILTANQPPEGVVFEITSEDDGLLKKVIPAINDNIQRLRNQFPDLPIAIVTHGKEQFDLTIDNQATEEKTHKMVKKLVDEDGIDVHVCGTHAEYLGVMPEEFPNYVDVSAEGPAQINDYKALGYEVITVTD